MNYRTYSLFLLLGCLFNPAFAGISGDLETFFKNSGYSANVSSASAYRAQRAGYYTGGDMFARTKADNIELAHIQFPSIRAGCGGIDIFTGGFSFVNAKDFITAMKSIASHARGYAFTLALEEVTPLIGNVVGKLQKAATFVNHMNMNSCESSAALVGSVWPRTKIARKQICQDISLDPNNSFFTDLAEARQGCKNPSVYADALTKVKDNKMYQAILPDGNLAWRVLQKNPLYKSDRELTELIMSLSGTIIIDSSKSNDKQGWSEIHLPPLLGKNNIIQTLLKGGTAEYYHCDEYQHCLHLNKSTLIFEEKKSLTHLVKIHLSDIVHKIINNHELEDKEIAFLQSTRIPIYKILNVEAALKGDDALVDVEQYSEVIAIDILVKYLRNNLDKEINSLNEFSFTKEKTKHFKSGIENAYRRLWDLQRKAYQKLNVSDLLIRQSQFNEKLLASKVSNQLSNALHE